MPYEPKVDEIIIRALYKEKKLGFGKTAKIVKELHPHLTNRVLNRHLNFMEKSKIIYREEFRSGFERNVWLTENTKLALALKWPIKVYAGRKEFFLLLSKKQSEINEKAYLLLIMLITINFMVPEPVLTDVKPGDIYIKGKPHRFIQLPGICANDVFHPYRDSANGWRFDYLQFKDASEVKWYLDKLMQFNPPIIRPINEVEWLKKEWFLKELSWPVGQEQEQEQEQNNNDATKRYAIADRALKELIDYHIVLLGASEELMRYIWKCERKPKPEEIAWYKVIRGEDYTKNYFATVDQKRNWLKKIVGTKADQTKKVEADAEAICKNAAEAGNIECAEYKTARMILDFIGGRETVNRLKSVPEKVYKRLLDTEKRYYTKAAEDGITSYSTVIAPIMKIMKDISYPDFIKNLHSK